MKKYSSLAKLYDGFSFDLPADEWAAYIARLLEDSGVRRGAKIMDLGCGTGAITLKLHKAGYSMTAVDSSDEMLEVAAQRFAQAGAKIQIINQDIRNLSLHGGADAAVMANDVINYLTDEGEAESVLKKICGALKPGGILLFDISSSYKLRLMDGQSYFEENDDGLYIWHNEYDKSDETLKMEISLYCHYSENLYEKSLETHIQKAYKEEKLCKMLKDAGFDDVKLFDGFSENPPRSDSGRIQFTAVKR